MDTPEEKLIKNLKIGIIGAGISGCSSAYFLKQQFDDKVDIVLFEKSDHVGGRLSTYEFNNRQYEIGGSILHPSNLYMEKFVEICGLEKLKRDSHNYLGLYDSNGIVFEITGNYFGMFDKLNFITHYGLFQLLRFKKWIKSFVNVFKKIYKLQDSGFTFLNLEEFLNKINPVLYKISQVSLRKALKKYKFNDRIINELASIACLSNYGQSVDVDGFVGSVSVAGISDDLWSVKNGNKQVPKILLDKSGAQVLLNTQVKLIRKSSEKHDEKNTIVYVNEKGEEIVDNSFDYILISFPIYKDIIGDNFKLEFDNVENFSNLNMQRTNTYVIYGEIKIFPNLPKDKRVELHSIEPDVPYRCISIQLPCDYSNKNDKDLYVKPGLKLYKIFAEKEIDKSLLDKIFESGYKLVQSVPWLAYPKYNVNPTSKSIPNIILDSKDRSRVFYLNSLEWSSSCMEICAISARNVTNLIANKENIKVKKFFRSGTKESGDFHRKLHTVCKFLTITLVSAFLISFFFKV